MQENKNRIFICDTPLPFAAAAGRNCVKTFRKTPLARVIWRGALAIAVAVSIAQAQQAQAPKPAKAPDSVARAVSAQDPVFARLDGLLAGAKYSRGKVAVVVKDLEKDSVLVSMNSDSMFNPASVSKLLTASMAFEKLGTAYNFKTQVFMAGSPDPDSGKCRGNLYIKGGGDPYFVVERMWLFVQHLVCLGLKSIEKDIVLDDSFFDSVPVGPGFDEDDSSHPYVAPVDAVSSNFNCVSIWMRPGKAVGAPVIVDILPKSGLVKLVVAAQTVASGKPSTCGANTQKDGDKTVITVSGSMPLDGEPLVQYKKVWQTWDYFGAMLRTLLENNSIAFKGKVLRGTLPDSLKTLPPFYVFPSVPLPEVLNSMMKVSNNYMAEMVFKTLSAEKDSTFGSWEKSSALALSWWKEKKLAGAPRIKNGSGMGDSNRLSGRQIVDLLCYVWGQKVYLPEFLYTLPVAGIDGTLKSRFKDSRLKGIVRAKTGTLNDYGISTIAGYAFFPGKTYAFAVLFNGCTNRKQMGHWEMQEKILEAVIPDR